MLHFLVAGLWETAPSLLDVDGDFPVLLSNLPPAPQGASDDERKALALVPQGKHCDSYEERVRQLRALVTTAAGDGEEEMRRRLTVELEAAAADAAMMRARYVAVTQQFRDLLRWLGEDAGAQPEKIFNAVSCATALGCGIQVLTPVLFARKIGDFVRNVTEESSRIKQAADAAVARESRARREADAASERAAASLAKALQTKEPGSEAASASVAASPNSAAPDASHEIPAAPSAPPVMRHFESAPDSRVLMRSVAGTVMAALAMESGARRRRHRGLGGALALQAVLALQSAARPGGVAASDTVLATDSGRRAPMTRAVSLPDY